MLALLEHAAEDFQKYALAHNTLGKERFQEADEGLALQTMNRCIVREYLRIFSKIPTICAKDSSVGRLRSAWSSWSINRQL